MLLGDFNLPVIDWCNMSVNNRTSKTLEYRFLPYVQGNDYIQQIKEPTRIRQGQNCYVLDLIITELKDDVKNIEYLPPLGKSDHWVIRCSFILGRSFPMKKIDESLSVHKFHFNKNNYLELNNCLQGDRKMFEEFISNNDNLDDVM